LINFFQYQLNTVKTFFKSVKTAVNKTDARTKRAIAVAGSSYLGRFGQGVAVLVTLPMARESLNPELFGIWMMLSALLGFMAFADLGTGNGVLNLVTTARATKDQQLLRCTLASGYTITFTVGCLLLLTWITWTKFSLEPTAVAGSIAVENRNEALNALTVFSIFLAINIPASLILRIQLGYQQGYINGLNQLACAVFTLALVPLVLHWGGGVPELVLATLGIQAIVNLTNSLIWLHLHGMFAGQNWLQLINKKTVTALLKTGGMFFLLQTAAAFAFQSDAIVITHTLGQTAYGDFAVIQKLYLFVSMLLGAAIMGLWPAFGDAFASNQKAWAITTLKRGMVIAGIVSIVGVSILSAAMPWILEKWMNSSVQPVWGLILALAIWTVIDGVASVNAAFMNGANILRAQLVLAVAMASTAFASKWILTPILGATGAVLGTIFAYSLISVPGQIYILKRVFNTKDK
jgi:O-antigen/teichoic acid export membrane protein